MGGLAAGCSVYESDWVTSSGSLAGGGDGGSGNDAGTGASTSGKSGDGGKGSAGASGSATSGTSGSTDGGSPSEAGEGPGGSAGAAAGGASGSNAGQGGVAATNAGGTAGGGGAAGSGGSGGTASSAKCSEHPLTAKTTWVASASSESIASGQESDPLYNPATHMTDGSFGERWSSGKTQAGDEWIQVDFGAVVNVSGFTLNVNTDPGDYPRQYALRVSSTSQDFAAAVRASGEGMPGNTTVAFPMVSGRYLTVRQTGVNTETSAWWTVAEVFATCVDP